MQFLVYTLLSACFGASAFECQPPIFSAASGIAVDSIAVSWIDFSNGPDTRYALEVVAPGEIPDGVADYDSIEGLSFVIPNLESGTQYRIYVRALCADGPSVWAGPVSTYTFIDNADPCQLTLAIPDNNCPQVQRYPISVEVDPSLILGDDILIKSVEIVVAHPWMADLSLRLINPSGSSVLLMQDRGVGVHDVGNPSDSTCAEVMTFSVAACQDLSELSSGFTGTLRPEESFNALHDHTEANGIWILEICDKASDDIGQLRFIHISLTEAFCDLPPELQVSSATDTTAVLRGMNDEHCDSILITLINHFPTGDTVRLSYPCDGDSVVLHGLQTGGAYEWYAQRRCVDVLSPVTCPGNFTTACDTIVLASNFDATEPCGTECGEACAINDTIWTNSADDEMDWIAHAGHTATEFTGPSDSRFGIGNYLYIESSGAACQDSAEAILESRCMQISGKPGSCDLSFWYVMYGESVGSLLVEVSTDAGASWEPLWQQSGDQGNLWHEASVDLDPYDNLIGRFRFRAITGNGFLGDIAIDDIYFFGGVDSAGLEQCYFRDRDMDMFGNSDSTICICSLQPPAGYVANGSDCDDANQFISPAMAEIPCNLIDDNCNGETDEGINPDPMSYTLDTIQSATCTGVNDGFIEISVSGGLPPYAFTWSNGDMDTLASELEPGTYQCTITDGNGCYLITEAFVIQAQFAVEYFIVSVGDPTCIGKSNGFISGVVVGGTPPYAYQWNSGHSTRDISFLPDGVYQVTVSDAQGCSFISEPVTLEASPSYTANVLQFRHVSCMGASDGMIRIIASNGALPPIQYRWSNGDSTMLTTNLSAGSYTCTMTDTIGCMFVAGPYQINEPTDLEVQVVAATPPQCYDGSDGFIDLNVNGGTPPYFFAWEHGAFGEDIRDLEAGEYQVTISDLHGCDTVLQFALVAPDTLMAVIDTTIRIQCPGDSTGVISLAVIGGTSPYRYDWSYGNSDSSSLSMLPMGTYAVTVSDALGCKAVLHQLEITATNDPLIVSIDEVQHVQCFGDSSGIIVASVSGGSPPYAFNWSAGVIQTSIDTTDTFKQLAVGAYRVTVSDNNGCTGVSEMIEITQPPRIQFTLDGITQNTCAGDSLGEIQISVTGGGPPYTYLWSHGDTTQDIFGLSAGIYQLNVYDSLGCLMRTPEFEVTSPDSIQISFVTSNEFAMEANGSAEAVPTGGTPPYSYMWDAAANGQTSALASGLSSGTYVVTVTDDLDCVAVDSVFIDRITGIGDPEQIQVILFPNPAFHTLIVRGEDLGEPVLLSSDGRIIPVHITERSSTELTVWIEELPAGMYFLRVNGSLYKVIIL